MAKFTNMIPRIAPRWLPLRACALVSLRVLFLCCGAAPADVRSFLLGSPLGSSSPWRISGHGHGADSDPRQRARHALVAFVDTDSAHCSALGTELRVVRTAFQQEERLMVTQVENAQFAAEEGVSALPSLVYFRADGSAGRWEADVKRERYYGPMQAKAMIEFLNEKMSTKRVPRERTVHVQTVSAANVDSVAMDPDVDVVMLVCAHHGEKKCRDAQREVEDVAAAFAGVPMVLFVQVFDPVMLEKYELGWDQVVAIFFPKGNEKNPVLVTELLESMGPGGFATEVTAFLREEAGILPRSEFPVSPVLDKLVKSFCHSDSQESQVRILSSLSELGDQNVENGEYHKVMQRTVDRGLSFLVEEDARLSRVLLSESISDSKRHQLLYRQFIISRFKQNGCFPSP